MSMPRLTSCTSLTLPFGHTRIPLPFLPKFSLLPRDGGVWITRLCVGVGRPPLKLVGCGPAPLGPFGPALCPPVVGPCVAGPPVVGPCGAAPPVVGPCVAAPP